MEQTDRESAVSVLGEDVGGPETEEPLFHKQRVASVRPRSLARTRPKSVHRTQDERVARERERVRDCRRADPRRLRLRSEPFRGAQSRSMAADAGASAAPRLPVDIPSELSFPEEEEEEDFAVWGR